MIMTVHSKCQPEKKVWIYTILYKQVLTEITELSHKMALLQTMVAYSAMQLDSQDPGKDSNQERESCQVARQQGHRFPEKMNLEIELVVQAANYRELLQFVGMK
jgi:hypothetical protein